MATEYPEAFRDIRPQTGFLGDVFASVALASVGLARLGWFRLALGRFLFLDRFFGRFSVVVVQSYAIGHDLVPL